MSLKKYLNSKFCNKWSLTDISSFFALVITTLIAGITMIHIGNDIFFHLLKGIIICATIMHLIYYYMGAIELQTTLNIHIKEMKQPWKKMEKLLRFLILLFLFIGFGIIYIFHIPQKFLFLYFMGFFFIVSLLYLFIWHWLVRKGGKKKELSKPFWIKDMFLFIANFLISGGLLLIYFFFPELSVSMRGAPIFGGTLCGIGAVILISIVVIFMLLNYNLIKINNGGNNETDK